MNRLTGVHVTPTVLFNVSISLGDRELLGKMLMTGRVSWRIASPAASAVRIGKHGLIRTSSRDRTGEGIGETSSLSESHSSVLPKNVEARYVVAKYKVEMLPGISFDLSPSSKYTLAMLSTPFRSFYRRLNHRCTVPWLEEGGFEQESRGRKRGHRRD